jgi:hypothetical protein
MSSLAVQLRAIGLSVVLACVSAGCATQGSSKTRTLDEITRISGALEAYKADYGDYPSSRTTESLIPNRDSNPKQYVASARFLYRTLSGDRDGDLRPDAKVYLPFGRDMIGGGGTPVGAHVIDAWGNPYGYSTYKARYPGSAGGNNRTFDLWSTGGGHTGLERGRWIKNWVGTP